MKFFLQAQRIAPDDPFVMHEMGVIASQNLEYAWEHVLLVLSIFCVLQLQISRKVF